MKHTYETKKIITTPNNMLHQNAELFFESNLPKEDDETVVAVKAYMEKSGEVVAYGAYYGTLNSPVDVYAKTDNYHENVFLAEALDKNAMCNFISKERKENIFLFKVKTENFHIIELDSFYAGVFEMDVVIHKVDSEEEAISLFKIPYTF